MKNGLYLLGGKLERDRSIVKKNNIGAQIKNGDNKIRNKRILKSTGNAILSD